MNVTWDKHSAMGALTSALPYIRLFKGKTLVVKVGGALCGEPEGLRALALQLAVLREIGIRVVLVHGGGPQTTALAERLGLTTTFVEGGRVTCENTLEVAVMTINGAVRTALLSACASVALPAVGLSGVDAGLVRARKRPVQKREVNGVAQEVDYGLVGDIIATDPTVLHTLLNAGIVPVVSPLCASESGQVLNVNADSVASALARALGAEKLIFMTDTQGLLADKRDASSLISYTDIRGLGELAERGAFDAGMLPKTKAAVLALEGGVRRVHMVGYKMPESLLSELFTNEGVGTLIVRDRSELLPGEQQPSAITKGP